MNHSFAREMIEKMKDLDKDLRWMACHNVTLKLQSTPGTSLDLTESQEKEFLESVCKVVKDRNASVAQKAQNMLGPLVPRLRPASLLQLLRVLVRLVIEEAETEKREVGVLGLKAMIPSLSKTQGDLILGEVISPLQAFLRESSSRERQTDCLIVLSAMLAKFGEIFNTKHLQELEAVLMKLFEILPTRFEERKPALACLSSLASCMGNDQFNTLVSRLITNVDASPSLTELYADIQTIAVLTKSVGYRFGPHLPKLVPVLIKIASDPTTVEKVDVFDSCMGALQSIIQSCSKEMHEYFNQILEIAVSRLAFDPDYLESTSDHGGDADMVDADDDDGEGFGGFGDDEEGFSSGGEGGFVGEDEDVGVVAEVEEIEDDTWRVRKSCAKVLLVLVKHNPDFVPLFYSKLPLPLLNRFCDRVETVQLEAMGVFDALSHHVHEIYESRALAADSQLPDLLNGAASGMLETLDRILTKGHPKAPRSRSEGVAHKALETLLFFVQIRPNPLPEGPLNATIKHCLTILGDGPSDFATVVIQSDALSLLNECLRLHSPHLYLDQVLKMVTVLSDGGNSGSKSLVTGSLRALVVLFGHVSQKDVAAAEEVKGIAEGMVDKLCEGAHQRLKSNESDQEIREVAIELLGRLVAIYGEKIKKGKRYVGSIFRRVDNEPTRLASLTSLGEIASSPHLSLLIPSLDSLIPKLVEFFRNRSRPLQLASLGLLNTLCGVESDFRLPDPKAVADGLKGFLSLDDLVLCSLSLSTLTNCIKFLPESRPTVLPIYQFSFELHESPLLRGAALSSLCDFYVNVAKYDVVPVDNLLSDLYQLVHENEGKLTSSISSSGHSLMSISKCVAAVVVGFPDFKKTVCQYVEKITPPADPGAPISAAYLSYIGQIGHLTDLGDVPKLDKHLIAAMDQSHADTVQIASVALGGVAVGCPAQFFPLIIKGIEDPNQKNVEAYLNSLLVALTSPNSTAASIQPFISHIFSSLQTLRGRKVSSSKVGQIYGTLARWQPSIISLMVADLSNPDADRVALLSAPRYMVQEKPHIEVEQALLPHFHDFFIAPLNQKEPSSVAKSSLESLKVLSHIRRALLTPHLSTIVPALYEATLRKHEKIFTFGQSQHIEDEEEPTRLLAYECLDALLDACSGRINMVEFVGRVVAGLQDMFHVKLKAHSMLGHLAGSHAADAVVAQMDLIVDALWRTISKDVAKNETQQEVDKQEEMVRGALKAFSILEQVPHAGHNPHLKKVLADILGSKFSDDFQALRISDLSSKSD